MQFLLAFNFIKSALDLIFYLAVNNDFLGIVNQKIVAKDRAYWDTRFAKGIWGEHLRFCSSTGPLHVNSHNPDEVENCGIKYRKNIFQIIYQWTVFYV